MLKESFQAGSRWLHFCKLRATMQMFACLASSKHWCLHVIQECQHEWWRGQLLLPLLNVGVYILLSVYLLACASLPWVCFCVRRWLSGQLHNRTYLWLDLAKIHPLKSVFYSVSHKQMPVEAIHFQTTRQCPQISPQHLPACWFYYLMILICCFILHALMSVMCTRVIPLYVPVLSELS